MFLFITFIVLFFIKSLTYYVLIESSQRAIILSIIGLTYIILFYLLSYLMKGKKSLFFFVTFYTLISCIMFIDTLYFKYFNQLTSIIMLKQLGQLGTISESISYVLKPINFLLLADIIPLFIFSIIYIIKKPINKAANGRKTLAFIMGALILTSLTIAWVSVFYNDINPAKEEFFTYHGADIYNVFLKKDNIVNIDKLLVDSIKRTVEKEKKLFAIAEGKNIITIQVEGLQNFVINREYEGQEITPNLNKLIKENTIYFDRYYQQLGRGNTSDAEFVSHNSLYPAMDGQTYYKYYKNTFYGLPWILKEKNYNTIALHGYKGSFWNRDKAYPYQGFDKYYNGDSDYKANEPIIGFGINDSEFFKQSLKYIKTTKEPFYAFMITLSSHHPFNMAERYKKIKLAKKHRDTLFGKYIQSINYTDEAIGQFIKALKDEGLYDNTIINIYGDHFGLAVRENNIKQMTEFLGRKYDFDEMMRVPLLIHIPKAGLKATISTIGGQIDFLPTILNLLGIENKKGIMMGQDLINSKEGFVAQQTHMLKGSFIMDDIVFYMSRDGLFKNSRAWQISTGQEVGVERCRENYEKAIEEINQSDYILKADLLKNYFPDRKTGKPEEEDNKNNIPPAKLIAPSVKVIPGASLKDEINKRVERGYRFIELDLKWASAGNLILNGMPLRELDKWLKENKNIFIITNIKENNEDALKLIKDNYPENVSQIIPQIYKIDEFVLLQGLGYTNIILNLYGSDYKEEELEDFIKRYKIFAVTLPKGLINTDFFLWLKKEGIYTYTYAVDSPEEMKEMKARGIDGFYIDI